MNWRDIRGYEGLYQVSDTGLVLGIKNNRILQVNKVHKYYKVQLAGGSNLVGVKTHVIHRLVAQAFLPNPLGKLTVNHIDGDKYNNDVSNLEWATYSENSQHAYVTGLQDRTSVTGSNNIRAKLTDEQVLLMRSYYIPFKVTARMLHNHFKPPITLNMVHSIVKPNTNRWPHIRPEKLPFSAWLQRIQEHENMLKLQTGNADNSEQGEQD